jgi:hypothetical protein
MIGAYQPVVDFAYPGWRLTVPGGPAGGHYKGFTHTEASGTTILPGDDYEQDRGDGMSSHDAVHASRRNPRGVYRSSGEVPPRPNASGSAHTYRSLQTRRHAGTSVAPGSFPADFKQTSEDDFLSLAENAPHYFSPGSIVSSLLGAIAAGEASGGAVINTNAGPDFAHFLPGGWRPGAGSPAAPASGPGYASGSPVINTPAGSPFASLVPPGSAGSTPSGSTPGSGPGYASPMIAYQNGPANTPGYANGGPVFQRGGPIFANFNPPNTVATPILTTPIVATSGATSTVAQPAGTLAPAPPSPSVPVYTAPPVSPSPAPTVATNEVVPLNDGSGNYVNISTGAIVTPAQVSQNLATMQLTTASAVAGQLVLQANGTYLNPQTGAIIPGEAISQSAAAVPVAAASTDPTAAIISWLEAPSAIYSAIPNWGLVGGAAVVAFLLLGKRR